MEYPIVGDLPQRYKRFADYKSNAYNWITLATGEYYPDVLPYACELYKPVLVLFGQLLQSSESSDRDQKLTSRIEPIQEHCNRTEIKKGFA